MQIKCPICNKNPRDYDPRFGYLDCKICRGLETKLSERTYEFVPEHIKEERKQYKKHMLQPFRNGQLSKEYIDEYGTSRIEVTDEEVKNAKNVWGRDLDYYKP